MSYGDRLKKVRKKFKLTQADFAESIGLKHKQTISDIENGRQQRLALAPEIVFCEEYNVNIVWLQTGKGEMFTNTLSEAERVQGGNVALDYYPEKYTKHHKGSFVYMKDLKALTLNKKFIESHLGLTEYNEMFMIDNVGESMEPTFKKGALLCVNPMENEKEGVRDGSIYVIMYGETLLVKRILHNPIEDRYTLVADNPSYDDIVLAQTERDKCLFLGRIVSSFNKV